MPLEQQHGVSEGYINLITLEVENIKLEEVAHNIKIQKGNLQKDATSGHLMISICQDEEKKKRGLDEIN